MNANLLKKATKWKPFFLSFFFFSFSNLKSAFFHSFGKWLHSNKHKFSILKTFFSPFKVDRLLTRHKVYAKMFAFLEIFSKTLKVSLLSTFYEQFVILKCFVQICFDLQFGFVSFWQEEIDTKVARKMLVKLPTV